MTSEIQHDMHDVGKDVAGDDAGVAHAEGMSGLDVLELAELERLASRRRAEADPAGQAENRAQDEQPQIRALHAVGARSGCRSRATCAIRRRPRSAGPPGSNDRRVDKLDQIVDQALEIPGHDAERDGEWQHHQRVSVPMTSPVRMLFSAR